MNNNIIYAGQLAQGTDRFIVPDSSPAATKPNELNEYISLNANKQGNKKYGLMSLGASALAGAMIGGYLSKGSNKSSLPVAEKQEKTKPTISGNYYSQVENIIKNLDVIFTPAGVIFTIKNSKSSFTLENIKISEMNNQMIEAYRQKNKDFFKHIMLTKMLSDVQIAEQSFSRRLLEKQASVINKIAGIDVSLDSDKYKNAAFTSITDYIKVSSTLEDNLKFANAVVSDIDDVYEIGSFANLGMDKYAGVITGIRKCIGFGEGKDKFLKNLAYISDPKYLLKNLKIGYFPDRVIFSCENQLLNTLEILDMNEDGYKHFRVRNDSYFKDLFINEIKRNKLIVSSGMTKQANEIVDENSCTNPLVDSKTSPVVLNKFMDENFGDDWLEFEFEKMDELLIKHFDLEDISEAILNKLFSIKILRDGDSFFTNAYAFEKVLLSFSGKFVDMFDIDQENIAIEDIAIGIEYADMILSCDDIYDNFGEEILTYISGIFTRNDVFFYPMIARNKTSAQIEFEKIINEKIIEEASMTKNIDITNLQFLQISTTYVIDVIKKHSISNIDECTDIISKFGKNKNLIEKNILVFMGLKNRIKPI